MFLGAILLKGAFGGLPQVMLPLIEALKKLFALATLLVGYLPC